MLLMMRFEYVMNEIDVFYFFYFYSRFSSFYWINCIVYLLEPFIVERFGWKREVELAGRSSGTYKTNGSIRII